VFDWDENNLRKIRAHRIKSQEVEQGLSNSPILIYEQDVQGELRTPEEGKRAEGIAPCRPVEPDNQRSDSAAITRARCNEGA
jgi:hypothetical protein